MNQRTRLELVCDQLRKRGWERCLYCRILVQMDPPSGAYDYHNSGQCQDPKPDVLANPRMYTDVEVTDGRLQFVTRYRDGEKVTTITNPTRKALPPAPTKAEMIERIIAKTKKEII